MNNCSKCGTKLEGTEKFCRKCGNKIKIVQVDTTTKETIGILNAIKNKKKIRYASLAFIAILVLALIFTSYQYYYFNKEYQTYYEKFNIEKGEKESYISLFNTEKTNKEAEIALRKQKEVELTETQSLVVAKEKEVSGLRTNLIEETAAKAEVQSDLDKTAAELEAKSNQVKAIRAEVSDINSEIGKLQSWVSSNAKLDATLLSSVHSLVGSPLGFPTPWQCVIDANEMGDDMSRLGFRWVDDSTTSNATSLDRIYDVATFWGTKKGDCEDFSLFMSAWLRAEYERAKNNCSESNITVQVSFMEELKCPCNFHVICGDVEGIGGHCEVAITNSGNPYSGIVYANSAHIIEPQGGYYEGLGSNAFKIIRNLFTHNDFITYYSNGIVKSLQKAKEKVEAVEND
ncbi:MAG: zinc-ribbon domain-containing protein [Candidatus Nanoarchaeia archaeon]|jgi:hypothetical protein